MMNKIVAAASLLVSSALASTTDCARGWWTDEISTLQGVTDFDTCTGTRAINSVSTYEIGFMYYCNSAQDWVMKATYSDFKCSTRTSEVYYGKIVNNAAELNATDGSMWYDRSTISCVGSACVLKVNWYDPVQPSEQYYTCVDSAYETYEHKETYPVGICDEQGHMYECGSSTDYTKLWYSTPDCVGAETNSEDYLSGCNLVHDYAMGNTTSSNFINLKIKTCAGCTASSFVAVVSSLLVAALAFFH